MRWVCVSLLMLTLIACTVRKPTSREPVMAAYSQVETAQIMSALESSLKEEHIPIHKFDRTGGIIVTDSFAVLPEDCDCGKNFFGAEYPGTRRGQMTITIQGGTQKTVKFKFGTLLNITANGKQIRCTSFGTLEEKILKLLEAELGAVRHNAQN